MTTLALIGWACTLLLVPAAALVGYRYGKVIADRDDARAVLRAAQITRQAVDIATHRACSIDEARRAIENAMRSGPQ